MNCWNRKKDYELNTNTPLRCDKSRLMLERRWVRNRSPDRVSRWGRKMLCLAVQRTVPLCWVLEAVLWLQALPFKGSADVKIAHRALPSVQPGRTLGFLMTPRFNSYNRNCCLHVRHFRNLLQRSSSRVQSLSYPWNNYSRPSFGFIRQRESALIEFCVDGMLCSDALGCLVRL